MFTWTVHDTWRRWFLRADPLGKRNHSWCYWQDFCPCAQILSYIHTVRDEFPNGCKFVRWAVALTRNHSGLDENLIRHLTVQKLSTPKSRSDFSRYGRKFKPARSEHPYPSKFFYGKGLVAWMSGNSAGRRHFGFAQVALCALADSKTTGKSGEKFNSTWFVSSVWTAWKRFVWRRNPV